MRLRAMLALLCALAAGMAGADPTALRSRTEVTLPEWDEAEGVDAYTDRATYEAAHSDERFVLEELRYLSGDVEVVAYLYRSRNGSATPGPTVIYNRGGYVVPSNPHTLLATLHRLGKAGFTVIAPYLRGSAGTEGHDSLGGADLGDIRAAIEIGAQLGLVDPERIYMYGESRGGMMTYFALRDGFPIRAAAVFGATSNLESLYEEKRELYEPIVKVIWPDVETRWDEIARSRSATEWPDALTHVPLLIMHGAADESVAVHHAIDLFELLVHHHSDVELWIAAGEGHLMAGRSAERDARAIAWFQSHEP